MYEGHLPDSGIQQHSAGELFPAFIVIYGDGKAQWINPEKQLAGRLHSDHRIAEQFCRAWKDNGWATVPTIIEAQRRRYHAYCRGERG